MKLWQDFNIQTETDLAAHLESFRILFAYNSNKIENDNTIYEDTYGIFDKDKVSNYTDGSGVAFATTNDSVKFDSEVFEFESVDSNENEVCIG